MKPKKGTGGLGEFVTTTNFFLESDIDVDVWMCGCG